LLLLVGTLVALLATHRLLVHSLLLGLVLCPKLRLLGLALLLGALRVGLRGLRALAHLIVSLLRLLLLRGLLALLLSLLLLGGLPLLMRFPALLALLLPVLLSFLLLVLLSLLPRLLVVAVVLLLVPVLVLLILMVVLVLLRPSQAGDAGERQRADRQDRALESMKFHVFLLGRFRQRKSSNGRRKQVACHRHDGGEADIGARHGMVFAVAGAHNRHSESCSRA
jgi:hypothetical protein